MGIDAVADSLWSLAVGHPIPNQDFRIPNHSFRVFYVSSSYSSANDSTTINFSTSGITMPGTNLIAPYLSGSSDLYGRVPARCLVVNSVGSREEKEVRSVGTSSIVVRGALSNSYSNGDSMTVTSNAMPAGWLALVSGINGLMYRSGYLRRNGLKLVCGSGVGYLSAGISNLNSGTYYKLSVFYLLASSLAQAVKISVVTDTTYNTLNLQAASSGGTWQEASIIFQHSQNDESAAIIIEKPAGLVISSSNPLYIDSIVLQHIRGVGTEFPGYEQNTQYDIPIYPSSIDWSVRTVRDSEALSSSYQRMMTERRNLLRKKITIRATFDEMQQGAFDNLMILNSWQERGSRLVLRTPYRELKPWKIGWMTLNATPRKSTSLSRYSVDMVFTEV